MNECSFLFAGMKMITVNTKIGGLKIALDFAMEGSARAQICEKERGTREEVRYHIVWGYKPKVSQPVLFLMNQFLVQCI